MKPNPLLLLAPLVAAAGVTFSSSPSIAQKAPIVIPPPVPASAASCAGERSIRIAVDSAKDVAVTMVKPVGGTTWSTDLNLKGRVFGLESGERLCPGNGTLRITSDEPEGRAALQTCAAMAAALSSGNRFTLSAKTGVPSQSGPGGSITVSRPVEVRCAID